MKLKDSGVFDLLICYAIFRWDSLCPSFPYCDIVYFLVIEHGRSVPSLLYTGLIHDASTL